MITSVEMPPASADPARHADCIELNTLLSDAQSNSFEGYARDIRISGTTDVLTDEDFDEDPGDRGGEQSRSVAESAWSEIECRSEYCGGDQGHYPFEVTASLLSLKKNWKKSPYIFQLLLAQFGHKASTEPKDGSRLFEKLCSIAAHGYLGGDANGAQYRSFGFPRSDGSNFRDALQELCLAIGDGIPSASAPQLSNAKDGHLDVVAWLPFCDHRSAQLIAFGQCATGANWNKSKLSELVPSNFGKKWLREHFLVDPIRMFFVPRTVDTNDWKHSAIDGGIVFDRSRITWCVKEPDDDLAMEMAVWSSKVHEEYMKTQ